MAGQWTPYLLPLIAGGLVSLALAIVAYRHRTKRGAKQLLGMLLCGSAFTFAYVLQLWHTSLSASLLYSRLTIPGFSFGAVFIFLFALEYTNREEWVNRSRLAALSVLPAGASLLAWVRRGWLLPNPRMTQQVSLRVMAFDKEIGWWILVGYTYVLILSAMVLVTIQFVRSIRVGRFRGQMLTVVVGMTIPLLAAIIQNLLGLQVALAPLGLAVTGVLLVFAVFRYELFDVAPVARRKAFQNVDDGLLLVDPQGQIIDANRRAEQIFDRENLVDTPVEVAYPQYPAVAPDDPHDRSTHEYRPTIDGEQRIFDVEIVPVFDARDRLDAQLIQFHDVTAQRRHREQLQEQKGQLEFQKRQLERQNERLDEFASIVSHDLRNPLNVAMSRLELVEPEAGDEHLADVADAHERMAEIIDDVLTLARQGKPVAEREPVDMDALCREAWETVETPNARLEIESSVTLEADRSRLKQAVENLFRNAVEHGSTDERADDGTGLLVRVGATTDGFYVEDNGRGIPEYEHEEVFEKGYTTADDGTGFGLSIVQSAVESHGWEINLTESEGGGARFEITTTTAQPGTEDPETELFSYNV